jgi:hypothetical protein
MNEMEERVIGFYQISFADFISYPSGKGLEKLKVKIEHEKEVSHPY